MTKRKKTIKTRPKPEHDHSAGCGHWGKGEWVPWFPVMIILVGMIFLLDNLGLVSGAMTRWWPVLIIVAGGIWFVNASQKK